jgi:CheY-like chemotaxis protein
VLVKRFSKDGYDLMKRVSLGRVPGSVTQVPVKHSMEHLHAPKNDEKTILVVNNEPSVLSFISGFLVKSGYDVLTASGGDEAVHQMKHHKHEIHLLLSTLDMPGVNGLGVAAQVSSRWPDVKVLLMSECSSGTLILNEGWHFLPKPFVQSQLSALISTLIVPEGGIPKYKGPEFPFPPRAS